MTNTSARPVGRPAKLFEFRGEMLPAREIASRMGWHPITVYRRLIGNRVAEDHERTRPPNAKAILVTINGETLSTYGWVNKLGIDRSIINARMKRGMTRKQAIMKSLHKLEAR